MTNNRNCPDCGNPTWQILPEIWAHIYPHTEGRTAVKLFEVDNTDKWIVESRCGGQS